MPIDDGALSALAGSTIGPVGFRKSGKAVIGELAGESVALSIEGDMVRAETTDRVRWPEAKGLTSLVIDGLLERVALSRPDLVTVVGDPAGTVTTTLWAEASSPFGVASAVKAARFAAAAARDMLESLAAAGSAEGVLLSGSASAPPPESGRPDDDASTTTGVWCSVDEAVDVFDLEQHQNAWRMEPGRRYRLIETHGEWTHVADLDGAEGWAATAALSRLEA